MHEPRAMNIGQRLADIGHEPHRALDPGERGRRSVLPVNRFEERLSLDVLHREEGEALREGELEDPNEARMVEPFHRAELSPESAQMPRILPEDPLERDNRAIHRMPDLEDLGHPAPSKEGEDLVRTDPLDRLTLLLHRARPLPPIAGCSSGSWPRGRDCGAHRSEFHHRSSPRYRDRLARTTTPRRRSARSG